MTQAVERKLARAKEQIRTLEAMIENQTRDLFVAKERLARVIDTVHGALFVTDPLGRVEMSNAGAERIAGGTKNEIEGRLFVDFLVDSEEVDSAAFLSEEHDHIEIEIEDLSGSTIPVLLSSSTMRDGRGEAEGSVVTAIDLRQRQKLEMDLRQAQKLESIGQLAAGIAHEINTPIQFVGDSAQFLDEAWADLNPVLEAGDGLRNAISSGAETAPVLAKLDDAVEEADLEFLREEIPSAIKRILEGVSRVAKIVSAMKVFSHPGGGEKAPADLNEAIKTTLVVANNEYKYLAELDLDLGPIPQVYCELGDINQVILNIVVNAAHAIESHLNGEMGRIRLQTRAENENVVIEIEDNGGGIPDKIRDRIFDPFFTTKDVGHGTGQGLAIARNVVVDKHGGELLLTTEPGVGSTFLIRLPVGSGDD